MRIAQIAVVTEFVLLTKTQNTKNGVIVPHVNVGQTVYGISRGYIIPIGIDRIQYSNRGIDILGGNEQYYGYGTITLHPDNEIEIEWYTTLEEALEALKGGNENER